MSAFNKRCVELAKSHDIQARNAQSRVQECRIKLADERWRQSKSPYTRELNVYLAEEHFHDCMAGAPFFQDRSEYLAHWKLLQDRSTLPLGVTDKAVFQTRLLRLIENHTQEEWQ